MATKEALTREAKSLPAKDFAQLIDHTLLSPAAVTKDYVALCNQASEWGFYSICVPPTWVQTCSAFLGESTVQLCTVIGFPFGYNTSKSKAFESSNCVDQGATELDMVVAIAAFKDTEFAKVEADIYVVVKAASGSLVKVILETAYLDQSEIIEACKLSENAGADFVKTSTGFAQGGATTKAVEVMRETVGSRLGVKASGGIRDLATAQAMINAGANRLGASKSVEILKGLPS
jgi:deoxyribose-phosphate aldolase